jgi:hypothetical protein
MQRNSVAFVLAVALFGQFGVRILPTKGAESISDLRKQKRDDAAGWYEVAVIAFET